MMEIGFKINENNNNNNKKKCEEGPTRNKKMRYFKILLCRNFARKAEDYSDRMTRVSGVLGQKLGYDRRKHSVLFFRH